MSVAQTAHETREQRALALYRNYGDRIRRMYGSTYRVPSQDGEHAYEVEYGRHEYCSCPDHRYRDVTCVHIYCLGIATAKGSIPHPQVAAGDLFIAAAQDPPHLCYDGWVYMTYLAPDEPGGDEVERTYRVPCRRCQEVVR